MIAMAKTEKSASCLVRISILGRDFLMRVKPATGLARIFFVASMILPSLDRTKQGHRWVLFGPGLHDWRRAKPVTRLTA